MGLVKTIEFLVSRGHNERKVLWEYSLDKLNLYYQAGLQNQENIMIELLSVFHAPDKYAKSLQHRELKREPQLAKASSKTSIDELRKLAKG